MTADMVSHDRAPSHRKPPLPRASDVAARLAAGEPLAAIAAELERTVGTLRAVLYERGYDSGTGLPRDLHEPRAKPLTTRDYRLPYALRYTPGSDLAIRSPRAPLGRFRTREQAESVRAACQNAGDIEVYDVREAL